MEKLLMNFIETSTAVLKYLGFIVAGIVGTIALIAISEITAFSHINFVPLGGPSWALWTYPIYFFISFMIFYRIFRLRAEVLWFIIVATFCLTIWWYLSSEGAMFENPIPFGISAY